MIATDRLPAAPEAERYILGAITRFPECAAEVFTQVKAPDFADDAHRELFAALGRQHSTSGAIEPVLACRELRAKPLFRGCEPAAMLAEMASAVTARHHIQREAASIVEARRKRDLYMLGDAVRSASLNGESASTILFAARSTLANMERDAQRELPRAVSLAALCDANPTLRPPIIDGLLRQGETANIVSHSKAGKSWLVYSLALAECTGTPWLSRYRTSGGQPLIVDNELHESVLAFRIPEIGRAHV